MNKKLQNKLKAYSALTVLAGIGVNDANAGVIVTDVDYTGTGPDSYDIDIDGDGVIDFTIESEYNTYYSAYVVNLVNSSSNGFMGSSYGGNFFYPLNLASTDEIGPDGDFYSNSLATLNYIGNYGNFIGTDGYVGVEFGISGKIHYGWIQLEVDETGGGFTVMKVAYNDVAGDPIGAGNTVSVEEQSAIEFNVNSANGNINITTDALNSKVDVLNIHGQVVASEVITSNKTVITNNFASGIYIVNITDRKGKAISRKITL